MNMNKYLDIAPEVKEALAAGKPVVALESTIISHGMPYPQNVETALKVEAIIREHGAVPATIAVLGGRLKAGLSPEEIDYLGKEPGIYSARYLGEDTSYDIKNQALLDRLEGVPEEKRTARFVCAIAAAFPDGTSEVVRGTMEGAIGHETAGENGFGYDPIFFLPEYGCTSAELSPEKKNELSHRGEGLRKMREIIEKRKVQR